MCDVTLNPGAVDYDGSGLSPGDTICLNAGVYSQIRFYDITGAPGNPVIIQNNGGLVEMTGANEFRLDNCQYVKLTGTGDPGFTYGIKISGDNMEIEDFASDIEFEYIEMNTQKMEIKDSVNAAHEMSNISVHNCWIHDVSAEGLYIGYYDYTGNYTMRNVEVYDNLVEDCSEGIQVGSVVEGCSIHGNTVTGCTPSDHAYTDAAIMINPGVRGAVYNNDVDDCEGVGIFVNNSNNPSAYPIEIYNNRIHNVGHSMSTRGDGIRARQDYSTIYNNTIVMCGVSGAGFGIKLGPSSAHDYVYNNVILDCEDDDIEPGGNDPSHFYNNDTQSEGHTPANYNFEDYSTFDYHLTVASPGHNAGTNVGAPAFDLENNPRPRDGTTDIGAYEFQDLLIQPDGDRSTNWIPTGVGAGHWDVVRDDVEQPTVPDVTNLVTAPASYVDDSYTMDNVYLTTGHWATSITVWLYCRTCYHENAIEVSLWNGNETVQYGTTQDAGEKSYWAWQSVIFSGLGLNQAQVNDLVVRIRGSSQAECWTSVAALYAIITESEGTTSTSTTTMTTTSTSTTTTTTTLVFQVDDVVLEWSAETTSTSTTTSTTTTTTTTTTTSTSTSTSTTTTSTSTTTTSTSTSTTTTTLACDNWTYDAPYGHGESSELGDSLTYFARLQAMVPGYATQLRVYVEDYSVAVPFRLGLYSDSAGVPDALLTQAETTISAVGYADVILPYPTQAITVLEHYWIAIQVSIAGNTFTVDEDAPYVGDESRQASYGYDDYLPPTAGTTYLAGQNIHCGIYVACSTATTSTSTSTSTSTTTTSTSTSTTTTTTLTSTTTSTTTTTSTSTSTSTSTTTTSTSTSTSTTTTLTSTSTSTTSTSTSTTTSSSTSTSTTTLAYTGLRRVRKLKPHVEVYNTEGRVYRPKVADLRWGSHYSPNGSGFGYLSYVVYREVGKDYPDIGYGMRVKLRKGLTLILFDGVITKITEKREGLSGIEIGCVGWKIVLENDRLNRVYADTRMGEGAWTIDEEPSGLFQPAKFDIRTGDEMELRPRQRVDLALNDYTEAVYTAPSGQYIKWVDVTWETQFPIGYPFKFQIIDENGNALLEQTATGSQSGSTRVTISGDAACVSARLTITLAGESTAPDDAAYAKITSVVIATQDDYPVDMATVMKDVVGYLYAAGHGIDDDTTKVASTNRQLYPAVFIDDQTPREILEWCAEKGNSVGKPVCWGMELNDRRRMFLETQDLETVKYYLPKGEAKTSVVGDAQSGRQKLYGTYQGSDDQLHRTADSIDQAAIDDMGGYFRRDVLKLDGVASSEVADYAVALSLSETKKPETSSSWEITGSILTHTGRRISFDEILPGGMVVDRNFKAAEATLMSGSLRDEATSFFLIAIEADWAAGRVRLVQQSDTKSFSRYMELIADLSR